MKRFSLCFLAFLTLFAAGAAGQTVQTTLDTSRDISRFSKYAWQKNYILARQSPEMNARMEKELLAAIDRELARKGYALDSRAPDFYVHVEALAHDETAVSGNKDMRVPTGTTVYTSQNPQGPGVSLMPAVIPEVQIIATEPSSETPFFRSVVSKKYKDPEKARRDIDREIAKFAGKGLKSFPPARKQGK